MTAQIPAFRLTVAQRMEPKALRERVGRQIRKARLKEGISPRDLAHDLDIERRSLERWEAGEAYPQLRNRNALAERLEHLTLDDLQPDLAAEEQELRAQLDRIERDVREILERLKRRDGEPNEDGVGLDAEPPLDPSPAPTAPAEDEPQTEKEARRQRA